ncbi:exported hypothetical protein [metagenome]|uniref:Uncharacterized protein n=1 Tax=metagenome TaxID=256318 RepID=A0A2P2C3G5_9ZZZZ
MRYWSRTQRVLRRLAGLAVGAAVLAGLVAAPAAADPIRAAGCKSDVYHQPYKIGPLPAYDHEFSIRFCWTRGGADSRIHHISGQSRAWAHTTYQVTNAVGPANSTRSPIALSYRSARNDVNVWGCFQSRNCTPGPAGLQLCTGWTWHHLRLLLHYGGGIDVVSRS